MLSLALALWRHAALEVEALADGSLDVRCDDCPSLDHDADLLGASVSVPEDDWARVALYGLSAIGAAAVLEALTMLCLSRSLTSMLRRREQTWAAQEPVQAAGEADAEAGSSSTASASEALLLRSHPRSPSFVSLPPTRSISATGNIPLHGKVLVPALLVGSALLFVSANTSVGASVEMLVERDHLPWSPWPWVHHHDWVEELSAPMVFFEFSLVNTITEMYKAKVYMLAALVFVWSGVWPYLKLLLLLGCWFAPPRYLAAPTRGRMLVVMDNLGKWCLLDIFLMVFMSVAFSFHITSDEVPHFKQLFPRNEFVLDVAVMSRWGMFGFVTAAIGSILMGHVVLQYHRTAAAAQVSVLLSHEIHVIEEEDADDVDSDSDSDDVDDFDERAERAERAELVRADGVRGEEAGDGLPGEPGEPGPDVIIEGTRGRGAGLRAQRSQRSQRSAGKRRRGRFARTFCCPCPQGSWFNTGSAEVPTSGRLHEHLDRKRSISRHVFETVGGSRVRIGEPTRAFVALLLVATAALVAVGATTDSFEFTFTGLAAKAIAIVQPESLVRRHSLVSVGLSLDPGPDALDPPGQFGLRFLQCAFLLFSFVMPLVLCVFLLALWVVPMRLRDQKIVMFATELISAFSALDCFIVSIMAACVEIDQFAQFLVGDRCDQVEQLLKEPCFGIQTAFLPGCWVTVAAALLLFLATQVVTRVAERAIADRELEVLQLHHHASVQRHAPTGFISKILSEW